MVPLLARLRLTSGAVLALLAGAPASAQTDMDVAWAKVRTCTQLNRFINRFGSANRYSARIAERRRSLCPASPIVRRQDHKLPTSQPQPALPAQGELLTGRQVADLYSKYWFCYDYIPAEHSCSAVERLVERFPDRVVIQQYVSIGLSESERSSWTYDKSAVPDRVRYVSHQEPLIRAGELCSTRSGRRRDAASLMVIPMFGNEPAFLPANRLQSQRTLAADAANRQSFDLFCSRYRLVSSPSAVDLTLNEESYRDRASQPAAVARIRLLPLAGRTPLLKMQE